MYQSMTPATAASPSWSTVPTTAYHLKGVSPLRFVLPAVTGVRTLGTASVKVYVVPAASESQVTEVV